MTTPCRTCGCDPNASSGHFRTQSGLCHVMVGRLECKCSTYVPIKCVCEDPENFCGGTLEPTEPGYCSACGSLDSEAHCLRCPFKCCAA